MLNQNCTYFWIYESMVSPFKKSDFGLNFIGYILSSQPIKYYSLEMLKRLFLLLHPIISN